jgi:hypothetical protein
MRPLKNPLIEIKRDSPRSGTVPFSAKKQTFSEVSYIYRYKIISRATLQGCDLLNKASAEGTCLLADRPSRGGQARIFGCG